TFLLHFYFLIVSYLKCKKIDRFVHFITRNNGLDIYVKILNNCSVIGPDCLINLKRRDIALALFADVLLYIAFLLFLFVTIFLVNYFHKIKKQRKLTAFEKSIHILALIGMLFLGISSLISSF